MRGVEIEEVDREEKDGEGRDEVVGLEDCEVVGEDVGVGKRKV